MIKSNWYSDPSLLHIIEQMKSKLPKKKSETSEPAEDQFNYYHTTINYEIIRKFFTRLKPRVLVGLGRL